MFSELPSRNSRYLSGSQVMRCVQLIHRRTCFVWYIYKILDNSVDHSVYTRIYTKSILVLCQPEHTNECCISIISAAHQPQSSSPREQMLTSFGEIAAARSSAGEQRFLNFIFVFQVDLCYACLTLSVFPGSSSDAGL